MKKRTTEPLVKTRKNPANSKKADVSFASMTDLFLYSCKQKNLAPETVAGYSYASKRFNFSYTSNVGFVESADSLVRIPVAIGSKCRRKIVCRLF